MGEVNRYYTTLLHTFFFLFILKYRFDFDKFITAIFAGELEVRFR